MSYRCNKCGNELKDGARFCPVCGEIQPERKPPEVITRAKKKHKKIVTLIIALLVLGSGTVVWSNQRALRVMPDLADMSVQDAVTVLNQDGIKDDKISFVDENGYEIKKKKDWIVMEQEPSANEQFSISSDEVILTIFDQFSFQVEQIKDCEGGKLYDAVQVAEEFKYRIEIEADDPKNPITTTSFKNSPERRQKEWIVTEIGDIDKNQKTVTFIADTEANIATKKEAERLAKAETALKGCVDKSVPDATKTADEWKFKYTLFNYNQEDCTASYDALEEVKKDEWQVIEVKEVKREDSTVAFVVDTKDNIAARETDALKQCINKSVVDAKAVVDKLKYKCELVNYDGQDYTSNYAALSNDDKAQWVVMAVSDIDTDDKTVTLSMDTKQNIEARKKAEEEKKQAEAAAAAAAAAEAQAAAATRSNASSGEMVWIPRTGHKYHSNPNCSNMKNPSQVPISDAISMGYDACKKCY